MKLGKVYLVLGKLYLAAARALLIAIAELALPPPTKYLSQGLHEVSRNTNHGNPPQQTSK